MKPVEYKDIVCELPMVNEPAAMYHYTTKMNIGTGYVKVLDEVVTLTDEVISRWLNITPRTFRNYKTKDVQLKDNTQEHVVFLLSLYKHGTEVFESKDKFEKWLMQENFFLDHKAPMDFLETISGIRLIDGRLTAMEFGENA